MFDFFKSLFKPPAASGETAKERLRLVLLSDHLSLAPDVVESLKRDLMEVISRYVEIDSANADVTFEHREREIAMLANIPITGVRERKTPVAPDRPPAPPKIEAPRPAAFDAALAEEPAAPASILTVEPRAPLQEGATIAAADDANVTAERSDGTSEQPGTALELAIAPQKAKPKPKAAPATAQAPGRASNAAAPRRRRRKKYAAAAAAAAANAKHNGQGALGQQASAKA